MVDLAANLKDKTQKNIEHISMNIPKKNQARVLKDLLLIHAGKGKTIIFTATKNDAYELVSNFHQLKLKLEAIHGDVNQRQREDIL